MDERTYYEPWTRDKTVPKYVLAYDKDDFEKARRDPTFVLRGSKVPNPGLLPPPNQCNEGPASNAKPGRRRNPGSVSKQDVTHPRPQTQGYSSDTRLPSSIFSPRTPPPLPPPGPPKLAPKQPDVIYPNRVLPLKDDAPPATLSANTPISKSYSLTPGQPEAAPKPRALPLKGDTLLSSSSKGSGSPATKGRTQSRASSLELMRAKGSAGGPVRLLEDIITQWRTADSNITLQKALSQHHAGRRYPLGQIGPREYFIALDDREDEERLFLMQLTGSDSKDRASARVGTTNGNTSPERVSSDLPAIPSTSTDSASFEAYYLLGGLYSRKSQNRSAVKLVPNYVVASKLTGDVKLCFMVDFCDAPYRVSAPEKRIKLAKCCALSASLGYIFAWAENMGRLRELSLSAVRLGWLAPADDPESARSGEPGAVGCDGKQANGALRPLLQHRDPHWEDAMSDEEFGNIRKHFWNDEFGTLSLDMQLAQLESTLPSHKAKQFQYRYHREPFERVGLDEMGEATSV